MAKYYLARNARRAKEKGMDILAEAVAVTGSKGRNVVLEKSLAHLTD